MDRVKEIKAEVASLLGLNDLYGVEVAFNTLRGNERYLTVKGPEGKEEFWDPHIVKKAGELFNEYYLLNRDDTEDLDLEEHLWAN